MEIDLLLEGREMELILTSFTKFLAKVPDMKVEVAMWESWGGGQDRPQGPDRTQPETLKLKEKSGLSFERAECLSRWPDSFFGTACAALNSKNLPPTEKQVG